MDYEKYDHHGTEVSVRKDLKGKHREHCLCYSCDIFNIDDPEKKCKHANALYEFLKANDAIMVSPVWECAKFKEKE